MISFDPKLVAEQINYEVDFSSRVKTGRTIASSSVTATVRYGTDASPTSIYAGSSTVSGGVVSKPILGGVVGVTYLLTYFATLDDGEILEEQRLLPVVAQR